MDHDPAGDPITQFHQWWASLTPNFTRGWTAEQLALFAFGAGRQAVLSAIPPARHARIAKAVSGWPRRCAACRRFTSCAVIGADGLARCGWCSAALESRQAGRVNA